MYSPSRLPHWLRRSLAWLFPRPVGFLFGLVLRVMPKMETLRLRIGPDSIAAIKERAAKEDGTRLSDNDVVCGAIWWAQAGVRAKVRGIAHTYVVSGSSQNRFRG